MDFKVFKDTVENNGEVKAIVAKVQTIILVKTWTH